MTRALSVDLAAHLAGRSHTTCSMVRIDLVDGTTIALTDHDRVLTYDLGDGPADYSPRTGILPSDLALSAGFDADDMEITGPIGEVVTRAAVLGGRFTDATVRYFLVNWADLTQGHAELLKGSIALAALAGGRFTFTVHSQAGKFSQSVGIVTSPFCRADFGDAKCGYAVPVLAATVAAVTDERQFTVSFSGTYIDDVFNQGTVTFTSGALDGCRPVEVFDWTALGLVTLWTGLPEAPQVGDTLELRTGCGKTRAHCMAYGNMINFRGEPDVPGSDKALQYPNPGGG